MLEFSLAKVRKAAAMQELMLILATVPSSLNNRQPSKRPELQAKKRPKLEATRKI